MSLAQRCFREPPDISPTLPGARPIARRAPQERVREAGRRMRIPLPAFAHGPTSGSAWMHERWSALPPGSRRTLPPRISSRPRAVDGSGASWPRPLVAQCACPPPRSSYRRVSTAPKSRPVRHATHVLKAYGRSIRCRPVGAYVRAGTSRPARIVSDFGRQPWLRRALRRPAHRHRMPGRYRTPGRCSP